MQADEQTTRRSLLLQLRDARNAEAWEQFVEIYTPLIYGFCRQHGLQDADAADVSQEVMRAVAQAIGRFEYNPQRGRFRTWLLTITRNKFRSYLARQRREPHGNGETATLQWLEDQPAPEVESGWDTAYHRRLIEVAAEQIRSEVQPSTWEAFRQLVWEERDGKAVAQSLGLSVGAVYIAKTRVLARLKERVRAIDGEAHEWLET
jgi:RNA polymerase sigma-70 factor (ECF subfamily)